MESGARGNLKSSSSVRVWTKDDVASAAVFQKVIALDDNIDHPEAKGSFENKTKRRRNIPLLGSLAMRVSAVRCDEGELVEFAAYC